MTRKLVIYAGQVQGVGFRQTVKTLARGFAVAGYVQNLPDGRVRLEAQGTTDAVQGLLDIVAETLAHRIERQAISDLPIDASLGDPADGDAFVVRY